ncbi:hypothetical protein P7C70_g1439, partial [Phenoliferia sp. Uapishka_3]
MVVALKAINLSSFSLSRGSSPSRSPQSTASSSNPSSTASTRPSSLDSKGSDTLSVAVDGVASADLGSSRRNSFGALLRKTSSFGSKSSSPGTLTPNTTSQPLASSGPPRVASDSLLPSRHSSASAAARPRSKSSSRGTHHLNSPLTATSTIPHAHSQPPMSRHHSSHGHTFSGKMTPVTANTGAHTPMGHTPIGRGPVAGLPLINLQESYVGNVSTRLGEAANKVFSPAPGPGFATEGCNGRCPPRFLKARELGEMIVRETHAALHDPYLLRTLLHSPILRTLSFFLTHLSSLPLPCELYKPVSAKDVELAHLPSTLRFNLHIVRCAYELKHALELAPAGIETTLKPWKDKLSELMARIMGPLVIALRGAVVEICARARTVEKVGGTTGSAVHGGTTMLEAAAATARAAAGRTGGAGPPWICDLAAFLTAVEKLITKLECGTDADKWLVSVGTCAIWKGLLSLSARKLAEEHVAPGGAHGLTAAKGLFKVAAKVVKTTPSPPESPQLHPAPLESAVPSWSFNGSPAATSTQTDLAFVRLICELEMLEARLKSFTSVLSAKPAGAGHGVRSGRCEDGAACGLCKTGRQFDDKSLDDEDEDEDARGLAHEAMHEAMQALSAMIVVVRASGGKWGLKDALLISASGGDGTNNVVGGAATPAKLLESPTVVVDNLQRKTCPTLLHALDTLPTLLLLHLLVSRLPPSVPFRLPHELWGLDWKEYETELRGFAAAEEWTPEIGWEMIGEVTRCEGMPGLSEEARSRLLLLRVAIETREVGLEA